MNQEKRNIWLKGIKQDISDNKRKKNIWSLILVLSLLSLYFTKEISTFTGVSLDNIVLSIFIGFLLSLSSILVHPTHPNYLAYYFYQIGNELSGFENDHNYLKRNQKYIKYCAWQIKHLRGLNAGYFSDNVIDLFDNLYQIVLHLNYIYTKGDMNNTYLSEENKIQSKFIELADVIHNNYSNLTPLHLKLTHEILNLIEGTPIKRFEYHKLFIENIKQKWADQHYVLRYLVVLLGAFVIFFYALLQLMMYYGIEKEIYVPSAVVGSIGIIAILFNNKDLRIKS